jgi:hypothetical protein
MKHFLLGRAALDPPEKSPQGGTVLLVHFEEVGQFRGLDLAGPEHPGADLVAHIFSEGSREAEGGVDLHG